MPFEKFRYQTLKNRWSKKISKQAAEETSNCWRKWHASYNLEQWCQRRIVFPLARAFSWHWIEPNSTQFPQVCQAAAYWKSFVVRSMRDARFYSAAQMRASVGQGRVRGRRFFALSPVETALLLYLSSRAQHSSCWVINRENCDGFGEQRSAQARRHLSEI